MSPRPKKFYLNQKVRHDFSGNLGTVIAVRSDSKGYDYRVRFELKGDIVRYDWYQEKVLEIVNDTSERDRVLQLYDEYYDETLERPTAAGFLKWAHETVEGTL